MGSVNQNKKVVIFDFDGTLADVVLLMRQLYGEVALKRGYPELTEEVYQTLRKGNLRDVLRWVGVRPWQLPGLMREGRTLFSKKSKQVLLFEGIADLIPKLHAQGWDIYVLSSNSVETIKQVLKRSKVDSYVTILKRPALFGKSTSIKKLMRRKRYHRSQVWMVGDEVRDVEAANKAGVQSVGVAWGLQHEIAIAKVNPTHLALSVKQLSTILLKEGKY